MPTAGRMPWAARCADLPGPSAGDRRHRRGTYPCRVTCGLSRFPEPRDAPGDAPLAVGGDLRPETLIDAYGHGVFPWPSGGWAEPLWWWSPDPRAVFPDASVHVSRSLRRTLRQGRFETTVDEAFADVVAACADRPGEGTWITPDMAEAYAELHELGFAHSVEVWDASGELVGGVYGVAVGAAFCGESMFHRATDASKVALARLSERLLARGLWLFDAQLPTPHLARLGAQALPRTRFLADLAAARRLPVAF